MIRTIFRKLFVQYLNGVIYNLQDDRTFYLGPHIFPQWLLACLPYARKFNNAALRHDRFYAGKVPSHSRKIADKIFLEDCLKVADTAMSKIFAVKYYLAVRIYGGLFYKGTNENGRK